MHEVSLSTVRVTEEAFAVLVPFIVFSKVSFFFLFSGMLSLLVGTVWAFGTFKFFFPL